MSASSAVQFPIHPIPVELSKPRDIVKIVFTDFPVPGNECVFVEVEDDHGKSIGAGYWQRRPDGLVEMVISRSDLAPYMLLLSVFSVIIFCFGAWLAFAALISRVS